MIVRITEGGNTAGLVRYLFGKGRANEHADPHIVAGSLSVMRRYFGWGSLSPAQQGELAHLLDLNMLATGTVVKGTVRGWNSEGQREEIKHGANHVWHASLSLSPEEEALSDETWKAIADDFMTMMGYNGDEKNPATCEWAAVRHGKAKNGGDHIHIVANVVREDGTVVKRWYDQRRAQRAVNALEHKYGLRVIEAREHARGARADSAQALNRAKQEGAERTDRQILEQRLRAAAGAAQNEADFIAHARNLGVRVRPRFAKGTTDVVTGYWAALHTRPGEETQWWSASKIARDLTLSRLRDRWEDTPEGAMDAAQAWRAAWQGMPTGYEYLPKRGQSVDERLRALNTYYDHLNGIDPNNPIALADATSDLAALYASAAQQPGLSPAARRVYDRMARSTGRHAQLHSRTPWKNPTNPALRQCAHLFLIARPHTHNEHSDKRQVWAAALTMIRLSNALAGLYESARQGETARCILRETQRLYELVHNQPGVLEARDYYERLLSDTPTQQSTVEHHQVQGQPDLASTQTAAPGSASAPRPTRLPRISQPNVAALRHALRTQDANTPGSDYEPLVPPTSDPEKTLEQAQRAVRMAQAMRHAPPSAHPPTSNKTSQSSLPAQHGHQPQRGQRR